jgi:hypothetical protein
VNGGSPAAGCIDPYGDTAFDRLQMEDLLADIATISGSPTAGGGCRAPPAIWDMAPEMLRRTLPTDAEVGASRFVRVSSRSSWFR